MTLVSMTGFGRAQHDFGDVGWNWELRSVNNKGLDIRLRLPPGFDGLEREAKKLLGKHLARGSVQASLNLTSGKSGPAPALNEATLDLMLNYARSIETRIETAPSTAAEFLSLKGVVEFNDVSLSEEEREQLEQSLLSSLGKAVEDLLQSRRGEGSELAKSLSGQLDVLEDLHDQVCQDDSRSASAIKDRLSASVQQLIDATEGEIDEQRLHMEAAILATKADVAEELDRLAAHLSTARHLLKQSGPVGRKLEFLAQEFNRETNTLCSKSNAISVTNLGLEMKVVIDQFREQILNVE